MAGGPHRLPAPFFFVTFLSLLVLFLASGVAGADRSCLDAADSAYLISADAVSRGLVPYRDFLAAHPPLLFILGAPLAKLGTGVIPFRIFSLVVAAALGLLVWRLALKASGDNRVALLAGALTLFAPLGLFFSRAFLNDSLVSLLAAATVILLMGDSRRRAAAAGFLCLLGVLAKLTFLPLLVAFILYVVIFRRKLAGIFLAVAVGGSLILALVIQAGTGGAYLSDILGSQASKGYSFTNFYEGLHRIWQMDWPLLVPAPAGIWFAVRSIKDRGRLFLLLGWLAAGAAALLTLPAEGHDTNLFQAAEPAVALLAAWGIVGLADLRLKTVVVAIGIYLVLAVPALADRDRSFFFRSNAEDTAAIVGALKSSTTECQPVLAPGCYALEADRPVKLEFFDQFLWEEKYRRGDREAAELMEGLGSEISTGKPAPVILYNGQLTEEILKPELKARYEKDYSGAEWPPVTLWLPRDRQEQGG